MALSSGFKSLLTIVVFFIVISSLPAVTEQLKKFYEKHFDVRVPVAVITIKGILYDSSEYVKNLQKYFKDEEIKAILLKIECPGSAAGTGQAIFHEIQTLKKKYPKPIITFTENVCASGGYYIASATDYVIASGSALVGSIGAAIPYFFQLNKFMELHNIHYVPLKAGKYKNATNPFSPLTTEEKEMLQSVLDDTYVQFSQDVARQRKLAINDVDTWANGKIFTGKQALKMGLIDEVGSPAQAVNIILQRALIESEDHIRWVHPSKKASVFNWLSGKSADDEKGVFETLLEHACTFIEQRYYSITPHV